MLEYCEPSQIEYLSHLLVCLEWPVLVCRQLERVVDLVRPNFPLIPLKESENGIMAIQVKLQPVDLPVGQVFSFDRLDSVARVSDFPLLVTNHSSLVQGVAL